MTTSFENLKVETQKLIGENEAIEKVFRDINNTEESQFDALNKRIQEFESKSSELAENIKNLDKKNETKKSLLFDLKKRRLEEKVLRFKLNAVQYKKALDNVKQSKAISESQKDLKEDNEKEKKINASKKQKKSCTKRCKGVKTPSKVNALQIDDNNNSSKNVDKTNDSVPALSESTEQIVEANASQIKLGEMEQKNVENKSDKDDATFSHDVSDSNCKAAVDDDDDDDDGDETEEIEKSEDMEDTSVDEISADSTFEALQTWSSEEEGDLSIYAGELLHISRKRSDGWWTAKNMSGREGLVPKNFLMPSKRKSTFSSSKPVPLNSKILKQLDGKLPRSKQALTSALTPSSSLVKVVDGKEEHVSDINSEIGTSVSASSLHTSIPKDSKHGDSNQKRVSTIDLPPSSPERNTLIQYEKQAATLGCVIFPKLHFSGLRFADLEWDENTSQIRKRTAEWQRIVSVQLIKNMPAIQDAVTTFTECYLRICLSDGRKPISNIHRIPLLATDKDKRTYVVDPLAINDAIRPSYFKNIFVRYNRTIKTTFLHFEIGVTLKKTKSTEEEKEEEEEEEEELSSVCFMMPLYQTDGHPVGNKIFELELYGENFQENVRKSTNDISRLWRKSATDLQVPTLKLRVSAPDKTQKDSLDCLPDVIVGSCAYLPVMEAYRDLLAYHLADKSTAPLVSSSTYHLPPVLAYFTTVLDSPILLDAFRVIWANYQQNAHPATRVPGEACRKAFTERFMRCVSPLLTLKNVVPMHSERKSVFMEASPKIMELVDQCNEDPLHILLSSARSFQPTSQHEFVYEILSM